MNDSPAPDRSHHVQRVEVMSGIVLGLAFLLPLLLYGPGEDEEGPLGIFASQVHYAALLHGKWLFWLNNLGFGTPLPIGQRLDFHPVFALAGITSLRVTFSVLWIVQVALAVIYFLRLAAASGVRAPLRVILLACYLFSVVSVCLFYSNDWVSCVIAWTVYPILVFYVLEAVRGGAESHFWLTSVRLGLLSGLWVINSHPGYLAPLAVILVVYTVAAAPLRARVYLCLVVAAAFCAAISAEHLYFLFSESRLFPASVPKETQAGFVPIHYLWAAIAPLPAYGRSGEMRLPFLGLVLGMAALWSVIRASHSRDSHQRACAAAFVVSIILSLASSDTLSRYMVLSGVWLFRDPMIFFGLLAAGTALQRALDTPSARVRATVWTLVAFQLVQQGGIIWFGFQDYLGRVGRLQFYQHQHHTDGIAGTVVQNARIFGPRILFSEQAHELLRGRLSPFGVHFVTDFALLGLNPVTGWFKSVSMDRLYPSSILMHGYIRGERDAIENQTLLDVLGINMVMMMSESDGPVPAGLVPVARMPIGPLFPPLLLLGNPHAWPTAALMSNDVRTLTLPRRPACSHDRALCRDYAGFSEKRLPDAVSLTAEDGRYSARFAPARFERTLFLSVLYRPEWQASSRAGRLPVEPIADAFIGVRVPPGVDTIDLAFVPRIRIALLWFSGATLFVLFGAWIVLERQPLPSTLT